MTWNYIYHEGPEQDRYEKYTDRHVRYIHERKMSIEPSQRASFLDLTWVHPSDHVCQQLGCNIEKYQGKQEKCTAKCYVHFGDLGFGLDIFQGL